MFLLLLMLVFTVPEAHGQSGDGLTALVSQDFTQKTAKDCIDIYPTGDAQIVGGQSDPLSAPYALRYRKGAGQGHGGTKVECVFPPQAEVEYTFSWHSGKPFGGYNNSANKILYLPSEGDRNLWGVHFWGAHDGGRTINVFLNGAKGHADNCHLIGKGVFDGGYNQCDGTTMEFSSNVDGSAVAEGEPYKLVKVYFKKSRTETSKDGIVRVSIDGKVRLYYDTVNFPDLRFTKMVGSVTWDGQCAQRDASKPPTMYPNDCRTYDDFHYYGHFLVRGNPTSQPEPPKPEAPVKISDLVADAYGATVSIAGYASKLRYWTDFTGTDKPEVGDFLPGSETYRYVTRWPPSMTYLCVQPATEAGEWIEGNYRCVAITPGPEPEPPKPEPPISQVDDAIIKAADRCIDKRACSATNLSKFLKEELGKLETK
jgi:hypothetical protein